MIGGEGGEVFEVEAEVGGVVGEGGGGIVGGGIFRDVGNLRWKVVRRGGWFGGLGCLVRGGSSVGNRCLLGVGESGRRRSGYCEEGEERPCSTEGGGHHGPRMKLLV